MNLHFLFFLLDVTAWISIALLSNYISMTLTNGAHLITIFKKDTILIALCAGFFSVIVFGIPDIGISTNSLMYAFVFSVSYLLYQQRTKKKAKMKKVLM